MFCALIAAFLLLGSLGLADGADRNRIAPESFRADLADAERTLAAEQHNLQTSRDRLAALRRLLRDDPTAALQAEIERLGRDMAQRRARRDARARQVRELKDTQKAAAPTTRPGASSADLDRQIAEALRRRNELAWEEADYQDALSGGGSGPTWLRRLPGSPTMVVIIHSRVLLLEKPFFSARSGYVLDQGRRVSAVQITQQKDGQPVGEALAKGGLLDRTLAGIGRKSRHVMFCVADDSVEAFRAAAKAAHSRGVAYGWRTWPNRKTLVARTGGGGSSNALRWGVHGKH